MVVKVGYLLLLLLPPPLLYTVAALFVVMRTYMLATCILCS
jgi:hypothetical protein